MIKTYTYIFSLFLLLFNFHSFGQEQTVFFELTNTGKYKKARENLSSLDNIQLKKEYNNYLDILEFGSFKEIDLQYSNNQENNTLIDCFKLLNQGLKEYLKLGNHLRAHQKFKESLEIAEQLNNNYLISLNIQYILEMLCRSVVSINDVSYNYLIKRLKENLNDIKYNDQKSHFYNFRITIKHFYKDSIKIREIQKLTDRFFKGKDPSIYKSQFYIINSSYHSLITKNLDSSTYYINKAGEYFKNKNGYFENSYKSQIHLNLGAINIKNNNLQLAHKYLDSAKTESNDAIFKNINSFVLFWKSEAYKAQGDSLNSLKFNNKFLKQELLLNQAEKLQEISEYETKYETEKKQNENLLLKTDIENEQRQKRILWISTLIIILVGSLITYLLQKNTKRKQKLAEQQKEIETQKLATVLKEQELTAIDAMIEGQEKERQRIANDLHDDLGGLMATVKLHFNALKDKKSPELFAKTNTLIDEAYNKVRSVAHAKNSGVIAKHGLLKSIKEMADKISISNKLEIEVIDYGLETRLENSLELTIFRITQELVSNAVKHAEASEITIHITNHDDSLNLMVEDNGKGFNQNQITKTNKGMGINSIDKRVEHLDGKMTIESEKNKGTTIIIDIPL